MFANLKNKIREETGSDVTKLAPLSSSLQTSNASGPRGRHSRQGSGSSLGSLSEVGGSQDSPMTQQRKDSDTKSDGKSGSSKEIRRAEEWRRHSEKIESDWKRRLEEQETEWRRKVDVLSKEKSILEDEKRDVVKQKLKLEEALKVAEGYKQKVVQFQDDIDQLEGFQTQEVAKVKHMDDLESLRHSSDHQRTQLSNKLQQTEEENQHLLERVATLERREREAELSGDDRIEALRGEREALEQKMEESRLQLTEIKSSWSQKIASLETQVERLGQQAVEEAEEKRAMEKERDVLQKELVELKINLQSSLKTLQEAKDERQSLAQTLSDVQRHREEQTSKVSYLEKQNAELSEFVESSRKRLEASDTERDVLTSEKSSLQERMCAQSLEIESLKQELKEHLQCYSKLEHERDSLLLRNAEVSQQSELVRQDLRHRERELLDLHKESQETREQKRHVETKLESAEQEMINLSTKISELEIEISKRQAVCEMEKDLRQTIAGLEDQVAEKTKSIRMLQQRLGDMKKTLQRELKYPTDSGFTEVDGLTGGSNYGRKTSSSSHRGVVNNNAVTTAPVGSEDDVNFKYLKHVIMKFLTSREYEAQHLTRAVSTLLRFSPEEEKLLKETLDWKMSWFGSRPNLGSGQSAKTIPPS